MKGNPQFLQAVERARSQTGFSDPKMPLPLADDEARRKRFRSRASLWWVVGKERDRNRNIPFLALDLVDLICDVLTALWFEALFASSRKRDRPTDVSKKVFLLFLIHHAARYRTAVRERERDRASLRRGNEAIAVSS